MKDWEQRAFMACIGAALLLTWLLPAAEPARLGMGKDFKFPDYYPVSNGVRRLKTMVTGSEARFLTNSLIALKNPQLESYAPDGKVEWTATSAECTVNIETKEVRGNTNMNFKTADERLFLVGVGFLWRQDTSVLIVSNQTFTWIDKQVLTNRTSLR